MRVGTRLAALFYCEIRNGPYIATAFPRATGALTLPVLKVFSYAVSHLSRSRRPPRRPFPAWSAPARAGGDDPPSARPSGRHDERPDRPADVQDVRRPRLRDPAVQL